MSDLRKLLGLSFREWLFLTTSLVALPVVKRLLAKRGFRKTEQLLARISRTSDQEPAAADAARVRSAARMVSVAAIRGPFNAQCLEQAVTLWWMLGLEGIMTTIRMGIYKSGDQVEAHAWVLYQDEIVLGELERLEGYTPLLDVNIERTQ